MTAGQAGGTVFLDTRVPPNQESAPAELLCDADILGLGEESKRFFTAFAADTTLFHAPEGDAQVAHEPAVHPNGASVNAFRDAMGAVQVLRPNARCQAVLSVVSVTDHLLFVVEWRDCNNRAEDFFTVRATGDG